MVCSLSRITQREFQLYVLFYSDVFRVLLYAVNSICVKTIIKKSNVVSVFV